MLSCYHLRHIVCAAALVLSINAGAQVKPGIEVLRDRGFDILQGKRVGLVTNPTGVDSHLKPTIEILNDAPGFDLVALYAPEHGVRGDVWAGDKVASGRDAATGLPVHSLYGSTRKPTPEMLGDVDVVVYDIQDNGSRSYTFISTLGLVMRACAELGKEVVVLDRPNPLGGNKVEGPLVRDGFHSFVGQYKIPYIYGLTVGELATLINEEGLNRGQKGNEPVIKCKLTVVPMEGWTRDMLYPQTGLPWVPSSPNIPYPETAVCYPASGLCGELFNYLDIGIGYTLPFGVFAEEWIDADKLKARLDSYKVPGVEWRTIHFKPISGRLAGKLVHGVQFFFTEYDKAVVTLTQFYVMQAVNELYGRNPMTNQASDRIQMFNKVCGSDYVMKNFSTRMKVSEIYGYWTAESEAFKDMSSAYYLYR